MKIRNVILCLSAGALLFAACKKEQTSQTDVSSKDYKEAVPEKYLLKLHGLGVDTSNVFAYKGMIYAENDYAFSPKFLDTVTPKPRGGRGATTEQFQTTLLLNYNNIRFNVPYAVRLESKYYTAISIALYNWNGVNSGLYFHRTTQSAFDIDVRLGSLPWNQFGGLLAVADFPGYPDANGFPGYDIVINKDFIDYLQLTSQQIGKIVTHEIGHQLGFRHSDYYNGEAPGDIGAIQIPGTPYSDPNSLMKAAFSLSDNGYSIFTANDLVAINALYPNTGCNATAFVDYPAVISGSDLGAGLWAPYLGGQSYEWEVTGPNGFYFYSNDGENGVYLNPGTYVIKHRFSTATCTTPWAQKTVTVN